MIRFVLLGLCLVAGLYLLYRWYTRAQPREIIKGLKWASVILGSILLVWVVLSGAKALAAFALPLLLPLIPALIAVVRRIKAANGPTPGKTTEVETVFLRMTWDHDSGRMEGSAARRTRTPRSCWSPTSAGNAARQMPVKTMHQDTTNSRISGVPAADPAGCRRRKPIKSSISSPAPHAKTSLPPIGA